MYCWAKLDMINLDVSKYGIWRIKMFSNGYNSSRAVARRSIVLVGLCMHEDT